VIRHLTEGGETENGSRTFRSLVSGRYCCALFGVINCCFLKLYLGPRTRTKD
jgi:hypothetical protein